MENNLRVSPSASFSVSKRRLLKDKRDSSLRARAYAGVGILSLCVSRYLAATPETTAH